MPVSFEDTNIFLNMLIQPLSEEQPVSHKSQHSVSSEWLAYWKQYL
jgi:hypothetical protein